MRQLLWSCYTLFQKSQTIVFNLVRLQSKRCMKLVRSHGLCCIFLDEMTSQDVFFYRFGVKMIRYRFLYRKKNRDSLHLPEWTWNSTIRTFWTDLQLISCTQDRVNKRSNWNETEIEPRGQRYTATESSISQRCSIKCLQSPIFRITLQKLKDTL